MTANAPTKIQNGVGSHSFWSIRETRKAANATTTGTAIQGA